LNVLIIWVLNFVLGIIATALLASQITAGKSISFDDGFQVGLSLYNEGLILYFVLILVYFFGAKKLWDKTVGGLIVDALMGKKK